MNLLVPDWFDCKFLFSATVVPFVFSVSILSVFTISSEFERLAYLISNIVASIASYHLLLKHSEFRQEYKMNEGVQDE